MAATNHCRYMVFCPLSDRCSTCGRPKDQLIELFPGHQPTLCSWQSQPVRGRANHSARPSLPGCKKMAVKATAHNDSVTVSTRRRRGVISLSWNTGVHTGGFGVRRGDPQAGRIPRRRSWTRWVSVRGRIEQPPEAVGSDTRRPGVWTAV
jgi:hypothetical protein